MDNIIFDGKSFAANKELKLLKAVESLRKREITPKLVSIVVGDEEGAMKYQEMKKKAAERMGCELEIVRFENEDGSERVIKEINRLNADKTIHGIMVQLPLPQNLKLKTKDLISAISPEKDVDGMRPAGESIVGKGYSPFVAPVVRAVMEILHEAERVIGETINTKKVVVVGAKGFVGEKLIRELSSEGFKDVEECDIETANLGLKTKNADILISTTGQPNLITADMVKQNAILIDVGAPLGDIAKEAYDKAIFVSPVPGGVGPVTIACLMENLVRAVKDLF